MLAALCTAAAIQLPLPHRSKSHEPHPLEDELYNNIHSEAIKRFHPFCGARLESMSTIIANYRDTLPLLSLPSPSLPPLLSLPQFTYLYLQEHKCWYALHITLKNIGSFACSWLILLYPNLYPNRFDCFYFFFDCLFVFEDHGVPLLVPNHYNNHCLIIINTLFSKAHITCWTYSALKHNRKLD